MKKIMAFLSGLILINLIFLLPVYAETFEKNNITIIYESQVDLELAIKSINWVDKFFENLGYELNPIATIIFKEKVLVPLPSEGKTEYIRVYGLCYTNSNIIEMTTWTDPWLRERPLFTIEVTKELHNSVIVHELTHLYLAELGKYTRASHEFFAYTVQIIFLSDETRNKILNKYPGEFGSSKSINSAIHDFAPHKYGVRCFKWYIKHNNVLEMIIKKEFQGIDMVP